MYVMSYFKTEHEALYLAISEDGLAWQPLRGDEAILESEVGALSIRDPHLSRDLHGTFHLFFTDSWRSDGIGHCISRDLLSWSPQELVPVMSSVPGAQNSWAPECFYDHENEFYRIVWSSTILPGVDPKDLPPLFDHRIWGTTTYDFVDYEPARLFFDPGYSVIDTTVGWHNGQYLMAFKDERGEHSKDSEYRAMRVSHASRADGPFAIHSDILTPALTEGPSLFRRENEWIMLFDYFDEAKFGAISSPDGVRWADITGQVQFPPGPRHCSVLEVPDDIAYILRGEL